MHPVKTAWRIRLDWCWFVLGIFVAVWWHFIAVIGVFSEMSSWDFDYPLRLLEIVYAAKGLKPYVDFGFVYPPGHVWFYGKLLGLRDPASINIAIVLVNLFLWLLCAWQVMRLTSRWRWWSGGTVLLVTTGTMYFFSESAPLVLISVLLVLEVMERGPSAARFSALFGVTAVSALFRWDGILFAFLEAGWAALAWLVAARLRPDQSIHVKQTAARLGWAALTALAGAALAMAVVAVHALAIGAWADTRLLIFSLPLHILPYRRLPVPIGIGKSWPWFWAVVGMVVIALAGLLDYRKTRAGSGSMYLLKAGALLLPCVAQMPYAFGRADQTHCLPLIMVVMVTSLVAFTLWPLRAARWLLLASLLMNAIPYLFQAASAIFTGMPPADLRLAHIRQLTADCTSMFPQDARSLFVGQVSYNRFTMNSPVFYLMRSDLRPATPFISDEPGIQNTCALGSRIAADLMRAPRPLVLLLDTQPQCPEPNLTRTMTSCGKIEGAISAMHPIPIGVCRGQDARGRTYRVMAVR